MAAEKRPTLPDSAAKPSPSTFPATTTRPAPRPSASSPPSSATPSCVTSPSPPSASSIPTSPPTTSASTRRKSPAKPANAAPSPFLPRRNSPDRRNPRHRPRIAPAPTLTAAQPKFASPRRTCARAASPLNSVLPYDESLQAFHNHPNSRLPVDPPLPDASEPLATRQTVAPTRHLYVHRAGPDLSFRSNSNRHRHRNSHPAG